jgi:hypothetical protein
LYHLLADLKVEQDYMKTLVTLSRCYSQLLEVDILN